jgi:hypothetical protein
VACARRVSFWQDGMDGWIKCSGRWTDGSDVADNGLMDRAWWLDQMWWMEDGYYYLWEELVDRSH